MPALWGRDNSKKIPHDKSYKGLTMEKFPQKLYKERPMTIRKLLPSILSSIGLFFGFLAIVSLFEFKIGRGVIFLSLAVAFDGLDGLAARKLKATSSFGGQLDSMCDMINFGVVPSLVGYISLSEHEPSPNSWNTIIPFLYLLACIFRLIRFNLEKENLNETKTASVKTTPFFMGLPSPGAACLVVSTGLLFLDLGIKSYWFTASIYLLASGLMVSNIRFPDARCLPLPIKILGLITLILTANRTSESLTWAIFLLSIAYALVPVLKSTRNPSRTTVPDEPSPDSPDPVPVEQN